MAIHESQRSKMEAAIKSIQPNYQVPPNAKFVIEDERQFPGFNLGYLFRDGLALITPLVWLLFALNLMGYFFLISWTPILMTASKLPPATAALSGALLQVGGTVAAIGLCWWFQRHRFLALTIMFACAIPVVASIGYAGLTSQTAVLIATFLAGFLVLGIQTGINAVGSLIYPTSLRANGSGWQLGIGRIGSIVGPLVGALLIGLPVQNLYLVSALPFVLATVICFIVHRLNTARLAAHPELREAQ
jgi:AAHS family 4-hydroxybenzoate transporter-like MFS transporter